MKNSYKWVSIEKSSYKTHVLINTYGAFKLLLHKYFILT